MGWVVNAPLWPHLKEYGWAPGSASSGAVNLPPIGIRSPKSEDAYISLGQCSTCSCPNTCVRFYVHTSIICVSILRFICMFYRIWIFTCICLKRRLFCVTLEISRTVISWRHSGDIDRYWYVRVTYAHVWARVAGWVGKMRKIKAVRWGAYYYSLVLNAQPCKYDMYKSSVRHIHDPVLSSLKMKGIRFFFIRVMRWMKFCLISS
jgi:hypothetical protein